MIKPSKLLTGYINGFETRDAACRKLDVSPDTLSRYLDGKQSCAAAFIESVKRVTGFDFEKAFVLTKDREEDGE